MRKNGTKGNRRKMEAGTNLWADCRIDDLT